LLTYLAGTTTPAVTYTTSAGNIAQPNPIILNASGRVPGSGEIWLTDGISYKFVLTDSNDVLIATYDNIIGINSNFVNFTNQQEIQTATAGQTVFNLTTTQYQPGTNSLSVFVDGVNQYGPGAQYAYVETDSDTVTFVNGLHVGALVKFTTSQLNTSGGIDAAQVSYDPPFVDSVPTNVEAKLAQYVSVKDFGAVGNGIVDDTTAIQNALDATNNLYFPEGNYKITSALVMDDNHYLIGAGYGNSVITQATTDQYALRATGKTGITVKSLKVVGTADGVADGVYFTGCSYCVVENCQVTDFGHNGINFISSSYCEANNNRCERNLIGGINTAGTLVAKSLYNKIIGNYLYDNSLSSNYGAGILLFGNADHCIVQNNVCVENQSFGILLSDGSFNVITSNDCRNNIYSGIGIHYDDNANFCNFNVISNNTCESNDEHGIVCQSNSSLNDLQVGHSIVGNQCISNGTTGGKGIYLASGIRDFVVSGNVCQYSAESGIECAANCARGTITGNTSNNNGVAAISSASGIRLYDTSTEGTAPCYDIVITNNVCEDTGANTQQYGVQLENASIEKIVVTCNKLSSNLIGEVDNSGTACQVILYPADGSIIPATDMTQTLGTTTNRFLNVASGLFTLKDGIIAPVAVTGCAFIYVESADGDLKVKFGNGTVKTIATNP
jgi:parallel beta-helix repeat protein